MKKIVSFLLPLLLSNVLFAQKPPIDHSVYDNWKSLTGSTISSSGKYIYYTVSPQEGDGYTELKYHNGDLLFHADRGAAPKLTENEAFFVLRKSPFFAEKREARIKKKKAEDMPKDSLLVYAVKDQQFVNYGAVRTTNSQNMPMIMWCFCRKKLNRYLRTVSKMDKTAVRQKAANPRKKLYCVLPISRIGRLSALMM
jgi:hypothetical protein